MSVWVGRFGRQVVGACGLDWHWIVFSVYIPVLSALLSPAPGYLMHYAITLRSISLPQLLATQCLLLFLASMFQQCVIHNSSSRNGGIFWDSDRAVYSSLLAILIYYDRVVLPPWASVAPSLLFTTSMPPNLCSKTTYVHRRLIVSLLDFDRYLLSWAIWERSTWRHQQQCFPLCAAACVTSLWAWQLWRGVAATRMRFFLSLFLVLPQKQSSHYAAGAFGWCDGGRCFCGGRGVAAVRSKWHVAWKIYS